MRGGRGGYIDALEHGETAPAQAGGRGALPWTCEQALVLYACREQQLDGSRQACRAGMDQRQRAANELGDEFAVLHVRVDAQAFAPVEVQIVDAAKNAWPGLSGVYHGFRFGS